MTPKLTKRQAKEFARIQSGILIFNASEFEFDDLTQDEIDICCQYMARQYNKLLKDDEYQLATTQMILNYVRKHF